MAVVDEGIDGCERTEASWLQRVDFDRLNRDEVFRALPGLSRQELLLVREREVHGRSRVTVLRRLDGLIARIPSQEEVAVEQAANPAGSGVDDGPETESRGSFRQPISESELLAKPSTATPAGGQTNKRIVVGLLIGLALLTVLLVVSMTALNGSSRPSSRHPAGQGSVIRPVQSPAPTASPSGASDASDGSDTQATADDAAPSDADGMGSVAFKPGYLDPETLAGDLQSQLSASLNDPSSGDYNDPSSLAYEPGLVMGPLSCIQIMPASNDQFSCSGTYSNGVQWSKEIQVAADGNSYQTFGS